MPLDIDFIRAQFPAFREPSLAEWTFFENAGGSYIKGATGAMTLIQRFGSALNLHFHILFLDGI